MVPLTKWFCNCQADEFHFSEKRNKRNPTEKKGVPSRLLMIQLLRESSNNHPARTLTKTHHGVVLHLANASATFVLTPGRNLWCFPEVKRCQDRWYILVLFTNGLVKTSVTPREKKTSQLSKLNFISSAPPKPKKKSTKAARNTDKWFGKGDSFHR